MKLPIVLLAATWLAVAGPFVNLGLAATTISLGTLVPEGTSYHKSLLEMREKWRKAPAGGANIRIFAGGKMGGEAKMVSQMRLGALDAALLTTTGLSDIEQSVTGLQAVPMMLRSLEEGDYIGSRLQPKFEQRMEKAGFVVLFWTDAGWIRFFSKKPMTTPEDLQKCKLFIWAGDSYFTEIWKNGGFQPVPLETADIIPMLDTGLINAVPMPPFAALALQLHDRAPHMLELNWAPLVGALVIRKSVWDKLPAAARPELLKAAREAGVQNKAHGRAESDRAVEAMKSKGLVVHPVSPELEVRWRRAAEPFYPKLKGKHIPADIWDEVDQVLKEYRAAKP